MGNTSFTVTLRDISERRHIERELIRLERMKARSEMAQGIDHNLNNLLNGILIPAQSLLDSLNNPEDRWWAEMIETSTQRAAQMVQRLNRAIRADQEVLEAVDVLPIVRDALEVTRPRWKSEPEAQGITIELVSELEDVPPIQASSSELNDTFVNLILNAVDALPEGGTITIGTQAMGDYVQLMVRDTGIGMDEETRQRVFEPFFSTKLDTGTGLGLYTVYTSVSNWGGRIEVDSAVGEGTTFTLRLPVWTETREAQDEDKKEGEKPSDQRIKILLVEDDVVTNEVLTKRLSAKHEVDVVTNGQTAVEDFTSGQYEVALIDLGIPGIPGDQVAQQLRQADASIVIVLITGFELDEDDARLALFDLWYQKPLSVAQLDEMLNQATALHQNRTIARS